MDTKSPSAVRSKVAAYFPLENLQPLAWQRTVNLLSACCDRDGDRDGDWDACDYVLTKKGPIPPTGKAELVRTSLVGLTGFLGDGTTSLSGAGLFLEGMGGAALAFPEPASLFPASPSSFPNLPLTKGDAVKPPASFFYSFSMAPPPCASPASRRHRQDCLGREVPTHLLPP